MFRRNKQLSDKDIILRLQEGGIPASRASNQVYDSNIKLVRIMRKKFNLEEDVLRDRYNQAVHATLDNIKFNQFKGESKISTYLENIYRNKCLEYLRQRDQKKNIENKFTDIFPALSLQGISFLEEIFSQEDLQMTIKFMNQLSKKCQEILTLAKEEVDRAVMAQQLHLKNEAVARTTLKRCREKLRMAFRTQKLYDN